MPRRPKESVAAVRRDLVERCQRLREFVELRKLATPEELADYAPGGKENSDEGLFAHVFWFANLVRFRSRTESDHRVTDAAGEAIATLAESSRRVPLTSPIEASEDQEPRDAVTVYPKSYIALLHVAERDNLHRLLTGTVYALRETGTPSALDTAGKLLDEIGRQMAVLIWIATTPGVGLPFDPQDPPNRVPESERWIESLSPVDLARIQAGFVEVNNKGLSVLQMITAPDQEGGGPRLGRFATFFASVAAEWKVEPRAVLCERSLASVLMQSALVGSSHREARAEAAAKTDQTPRPGRGRRR